MKPETWVAICSTAVAALAVIASTITARYAMRRQSEDLHIQLQEQSQQRQVDRLWEVKKEVYSSLLRWIHGDLLGSIEAMAHCKFGDSTPPPSLPAEIRGILLLVAADNVLGAWNALNIQLSATFRAVKEECEGIANDPYLAAKGISPLRSDRITGDLRYGDAWRNLENNIRKDIGVEALWRLT